MHKIMTACLLLAMALLPKMACAANEVVEVLPGSNQLTPVISTATPNVAVALSTTTASRVDTDVASSLTSLLGASYKRSRLIVQNSGSTTIYCSHSAAVALATGFKITTGTTWTFDVGKSIYVYCISETSAGEVRVCGYGWRQ